MKNRILSFILLCTLSLPLAAMAPMEPPQPTKPQPTFWQKHKRPLIYTGAAILFAGFCLYQLYKNCKSSKEHPETKKPESLWDKTKHFTQKSCAYLAHAFSYIFDLENNNSKPSDKPEEPNKNDVILCSICCESLNDDDRESGDMFLQTPCKHIFHHNCLDPWLKKSLTCPNCRTSISEPCTVLMCTYCKSESSTISNPFCIYEPCSNENCNMLGLVFHKDCFAPAGPESNPQCPSCNEPRKMKLFATSLD